MVRVLIARTVQTASCIRRFGFALMSTSAAYAPPTALKKLRKHLSGAIPCGGLQVMLVRSSSGGRETVPFLPR